MSCQHKPDYCHTVIFGEHVVLNQSVHSSVTNKKNSQQLDTEAFTLEAVIRISIYHFCKYQKTVHQSLEMQLKYILWKKLQRHLARNEQHCVVTTAQQQNLR